MSLYNQLVKPKSASSASIIYKSLADESISPRQAIKILSDGSMCPIVHWNAIWHHRIAVELCARLCKDPFEFEGVYDDLFVYQQAYNRMFSTMPLRSNKSFSYYLGAIALDATLLSKKDSEKNLKVFHNIVTHLVGDGAFVEGSHYSIFCSSSFYKIYDLLCSYYGKTPMWVEVCEAMHKLKLWQGRISNSSGVVASIGDSWYEVVKPTEEYGRFKYDDMTVYRNKKFTVIKNHRKSPWALHEHPHLDEILVSVDGRWVVQGSGMPSYKQVMANPLKWRRPYNHYVVEKGLLLPFFWRLKKKNLSKRTINLSSETLNIHDEGENTIRWPCHTALYPIQKRPNKNLVEFAANGAEFWVSGNIKNVEYDYAWRSLTYRDEEKTKVICITGKDLITTIK